MRSESSAAFDELRPEYDFDYSTGVRGKYYARLLEEGVDDQTALRLWPMIARTVFVPHTEAEYEHIVTLLDRLVDEVGEDESHPLASLMEVLGVLVEAYEHERVPRLSAHKSTRRLAEGGTADRCRQESARPEEKSRNSQKITARLKLSN